MLNLKKKLFTIALSLFCAGQLMAVPALPGKMVAKQADGTMITIQKLGDEHYHMTVTEDGYPLKYNFATNNYEYAELTEQGLVSSNIVAMPVAQRDARAGHAEAQGDDAQGGYACGQHHVAGVKEPQQRIGYGPK